jgi:hypothetical protein
MTGDAKMQNNWIREGATNFVSCAPNAPLTDGERAAVDRKVGESQVVAIGEATHGSKEIIQSRERVLRYLIQERMAAIVVLEACFAATQPLNRYVIHGDGAAEEAIVATTYWSYANHETLGFVNWLRNYNRVLPGANRPVRIYGCDVQSIDGPKTELARLLQGFGRIQKTLRRRQISSPLFRPTVSCSGSSSCWLVKGVRTIRMKPGLPAEPFLTRRRHVHLALGYRNGVLAVCCQSGHPLGGKLLKSSDLVRCYSFISYARDRRWRKHESVFSGAPP